MDNANINKNLYKVFLSIVKYIPVLLSILFILHNILVYIEVITPLLLYIGGMSIISITVLYLISWIFKFCYLYRIPLHYISAGNLIGILDSIFTFPISNLGMLRIYFILFGITAIIYIWCAYKNRNKPKVDPIKQLCETYCDCNC
jgi:hypothetical protein